MEYSDGERGYLWLCGCTDHDYRTRISLLRAGAPEDFLTCADERYIALGAKFPPKEERKRELQNFLESLDEAEIFAVTLLSEEYPEPLKHINQPPLVLYGKGRRELLSRPKFCIVGSRIIPPWAAKLGKGIAEELSARFAIVTGLAEGGDLAAIEGALSSGNLISVLPCGLTECYPAAHANLKARIAEQGLLLSELLPGEPAKKYSFHARNRLLAGLSEGVLVLSAAKRSGTLITASCALDFGRDLFALPHNVGALQGEGCNDLIKRGAYLVTEASDILSVYGFTSTKRQKIELSDEEREVVFVLRDYGEMHLAEIASRLHRPVAVVSAVLSSLEIKGVAVKAGANRYAVVL